MKIRSLLTTTVLATLITLTIHVAPVAATETQITTVTAAADSTEPGATTNYTVTFDIAFGAGAAAVRFYPLNDDGSIGDDTLSGFSFASTTISSTQFTATANSVGGDTELAINFSSMLSPGSYTMTLNNVLNTSTEDNYKLGMSTVMSPADSDFILSETITIETNPCADITTADYDDARVRIFGTNFLAVSPTVDGATHYSVQYSTTESDLADNIGTTQTIDDTGEVVISELTARTTYYVMVNALNSDDCVIATKTVTKDSEKRIENQRYAKPTVNRIGATSATAHWVSDVESATYDLQLWKGDTKLKQFNNLTSLRKALTNRYLNSDQTYKVRVRADYSTGETSRWSEFKRFTTN